VTIENSIQPPTTTNLGHKAGYLRRDKRPSIRVLNDKKEPRKMLGGCRVHILIRDF
jgi:hypothetical protein